MLLTKDMVKTYYGCCYRFVGRFKGCNIGSVLWHIVIAHKVLDLGIVHGEQGTMLPCVFFSLMSTIDEVEIHDFGNIQKGCSMVLGQQMMAHMVVNAIFKRVLVTKKELISIKW